MRFLLLLVVLMKVLFGAPTAFSQQMATPGVQSPSQQTSEEAAVRKLSELQFHQGHDLTCLAGAHETGDSKQGASVSLVKFDPGCIIPWHWHMPNENVMVVDVPFYRNGKTAYPLSPSAEILFTSRLTKSIRQRVSVTRPA